MSDIVERLRENSPEMPTRDRYEAADTIEALRAENARLRDEIERLQKYYVTLMTNADDLRASAAIGDTE